MTTTLGDIAYVVKSLYDKRQPINLAARAHPFMSQVPKDPKFTGNDIYIPVQFGNAQGISNTFSNAQSNAGAHKGIRWQLTRAKKYGIYQLDAETLHATGNDEGAFVREVKHGFDSLMEEFINDCAIALYGDGTGSLGQISSGGGTTTLTLTSAADAQKFEVGETILADTTAGGGGSAHGTAVITGIDEDAGTLTIAAAGALANSDYLHRDGNLGNEIKGLASWIPSSAPTSASFFGVDRTQHATRLGGHRVSATSAMDLDEALLDLGSRIHRKKGRPERIFCSPTTFTTMVNKLGAKVEREQGGTATAGFEYISFATPAGIQKVVPDPDCPNNRAYMLEMSSLGIKHLLELPHVVDEDGNMMLRMASEDSVEMRCRGWWQLYSRAPGHNGVVSWT